MNSRLILTGVLALATFSLAPTCLVGVAAEADNVLSTQDGLTLAFTDRGAVRTLTVDGAECPADSSSDKSGFFVIDVAAGSGPARLRGTCKSADGALVLKDKALDLNLTAQVSAHKDYIHVKGDLEDTSGKDRAVSVGFALPVDAVGWRWWDDIVKSRTVEPGETYLNVRFCGPVGASEGMSRYPCCAIENGKAGLSLAVRMDEPRMFVTEYDAEDKLFQIRFDVGLSPDTKKFPSKADFSFIIYRHDPEWGFRSAAERYYGFYPRFFTKRMQKEGGWICLWNKYQMDPSTPNVEDFGWQFALFNINDGPDAEIHPMDQIRYARKHGWYALVYTQPALRMMGTGPSGETPTREECIAVVRRSADPNEEPVEHPWWESLAYGVSLDPVEMKREFAKAMLVSAPHDENGEITLIPTSKIEGSFSGGMWQLNTDNDIPGGMGEFYRKWEFDPGFKVVRDAGMTLDGVYLDSYDAWGASGTLNYRAEHFRYVDIPLTFGRETKKPCIFNGFSTYEYTKDLADRLHPENKFILANWFHKFEFHPCHLWDVIGSEGAMRNDMLGRIVAYQKPYCDLFVPADWETYKQKSLHGAYPEETYTGYIKRHMLYAVFPGRAQLDDEGRQAHRKYVPIIRLLAKAGWEPVTYARVDDAAILVERYGGSDKSGLYFSLHNSALDAKQFVLRIHADKLGVDADASSVEDLVSKSTVRHEQAQNALRVPMTLAGKDTTVLRIRSSR